MGGFQPFQRLKELLFAILQKLPNADSRQDIDSLAKLNALIGNASIASGTELTNAVQSIRGNVLTVADSLEKLYGIIQGLTLLFSVTPNELWNYVMNVAFCSP